MNPTGRLLRLIIAAVFVLTLFSTAAFAVPQMINYQGYLTGSGGAVVNGTVSMTFAIYNAPTGGSPLWSETQPSVQVTDGAFSVLLGSVTPINLLFDGQYYLGVTVGADAEMMPRAVLVSVPYAMRAKEADVVDAASHNHDADYVNVAGDSMSGALSVTETGSSHAIRGQNAGTGSAGFFHITNTDSVSDALFATTDGNGSALYGISYGGGHTIYGTQYGTGQAGRFEISNTASTSHALFAQTNGTGYAVYGYNTGTGRAGYFQIANTASTSHALFAQTNGTGFSGYFGGGAGVYVSGNLSVTGSISGDGSGLTGVGSPQVSFYASKTSTAFHTPGSESIINFDITRHNDGAAFNTSTYKFTAPYDGVYQFSIGLDGSGLESGKDVKLYLNKNNVDDILLDRWYASGINQYWSLNGTVTMKLLAGDTVDIRALNNNVSANVAINGSVAFQYSYFSGHLVY